MGSNRDGRLGIDQRSLTYTSSPYLVESLSSYTIVKVSCGWTHTAAITGIGKLYVR